MRARVVQQRRRRDAPLRNSLGIQKRLQSGAWLAQRQNPVYLGGGAQLTGRPHPSQHFATGVVQNHNRAVLDMTPPQFTQLLVQRLQSHALQRRAQGGAQRLGQWPAALAQHLPRQMRGNALGGREFAPLQRGLGEKNDAIAIHRGDGRFHGPPYRACALPHLHAGRIGCAHQSRCDSRFTVVQTGSCLAE